MLDGYIKMIYCQQVEEKPMELGVLECILAVARERAFLRQQPIYI